MSSPRVRREGGVEQKAEAERFARKMILLGRMGKQKDKSIDERKHGGTMIKTGMGQFDHSHNVGSSHSLQKEVRLQRRGKIKATAT